MNFLVIPTKISFQQKSKDVSKTFSRAKEQDNF